MFGTYFVVNTSIVLGMDCTAYQGGNIAGQSSKSAL